MTLVRSNAVITVDGQALTAAEAGLARLRAQIGLGARHDGVELICWPSSKLAAARSGASLSLALGHKGEEVDLLTGTVEAVRTSADAVVLQGVDASMVLSRTFVFQTFLEMSIADIVQQLAGEGGVGTDEVACDILLASHAIDARTSVWSHIVELADLAGADLSVNAAGELRFVVPAGAGGGGGLGAVAGAAAGALGFGGSGGLRFGANVLGWQAATGREATAPRVAAYGAASEAGASKWHWIKKEPGFSGDGPPRVVPTLRTRDAAEAVHSAWTARARRARVRGSLQIVGDASIRPGDTISVADLPSGDPGPLRVVALEHLLDGTDGFLTTLTVEAAQ